MDWYQNHANFTAFDDNANQPTSFKHEFRVRFHTRKQKALWQKELFEIKQGTDSVDTYVNKFRELKERVDRTNAFPADFIVQLFIQGLRPEYAINVQANEPADLATAITAAIRWETGHIMANKKNNETDQAIKQLTDQIAQLSINLAQKQQPPISTSTNYVDTNNRPDQDHNRCYYCGKTGHFAIKCRKRKEDEQDRNRSAERRYSNYSKNDRKDYQDNNRNRNYQRNDRGRDYHRDDRSKERRNSYSRSRSRDYSRSDQDRS